MLSGSSVLQNVSPVFVATQMLNLFGKGIAIQRETFFGNGIFFCLAKGITSDRYMTTGRLKVADLEHQLKKQAIEKDLTVLDNIARLIIRFL